MLIKRATTRECERLFRERIERNGHRFERYKKNRRPPLYASPAFVQVNHGSNSTLALSEGVSYTGAVTAGDFLVACVVVSNAFAGTVACTVADNINGAWTAVGSPAVDNSQEGCQSQFFYFPNTASASGGSLTVTATTTGVTQKFVMAILEYSGVATTSVLDGTPQSFVSPLNADTTTTTPSVTTSNTPDLMLAAIGAAHSNSNVNPGTITVTGYTSRVSFNGYINVADFISSSSGSVGGGVFSWQFGTEHIDWTVAFKAAVSGDTFAESMKFNYAG